MRRWAICLSAVLVVLVGCAGTQRPLLPDGTPIEPDLYDMTQRWQVVFGLDGKLVVSNGRRDARAAAGDGPVTLSFDAQPMQTGWYAVTFIHVDDLDRVCEVRTVRMNVRHGAQNSKAVLVTPDSGHAAQILYVAPGEKVKVNWQYNPGGEGIRGGWRLMKTVYSDARTPPSVPGFEDARGV